MGVGKGSEKEVDRLSGSGKRAADPERQASDYEADQGRASGFNEYAESE